MLKLTLVKGWQQEQKNLERRRDKELAKLTRWETVVQKCFQVSELERVVSQIYNI